jgi:Na+/H+-dicarboxylate symporter
MRHTLRTLVALAAGVVVGTLISWSGNPTLAASAGYVGAIGTLWANALRMMVIPLVIPAILIGVSSLPHAGSLGRLGGRVMIVCAAFLLVAASLATAIVPAFLARLTIDPTAAAALRSTAMASGSPAARSAEQLGGFAEWLVQLVPVNPLKAATDGAMIPLILFTLFFGVAVTRLPGLGREDILRAVRALYEVALVMVRWVLDVAPIGVFALAVSLGAKVGLAAAGAVVFYVALASALTLTFGLLLYGGAWVLGDQRPATFARACAPVQAVALSSRSSLACLPAMLESADTALGLELSTRSFVLPLAVAIFRPGGAIAIPVGVLFLARLYGVEMSALQLVGLALWSVVTTFGAAGVPGGSIIAMVPVLLSSGLPVDAVGLLLAVDAIPDMCRTVTNVTGDMAVAAIVGRAGSGVVPNAL